MENSITSESYAAIVAENERHGETPQFWLAEVFRLVRLLIVLAVAVYALRYAGGIADDWFELQHRALDLEFDIVRFDEPVTTANVIWGTRHNA